MTRGRIRGKAGGLPWFSLFFTTHVIGLEVLAGWQRRLRQQWARGRLVLQVRG